jgi:hypothetical protein
VALVRSVVLPEETYSRAVRGFPARPVRPSWIRSRQECQRSELYALLTRLGSLRGLDADVHPGYRAGDHAADGGDAADQTFEQ